MDAILRGVARILDLGGTMSIELPEQDDAAALASDWQVVANDMWLVIDPGEYVVLDTGEL